MVDVAKPQQKKQQWHYDVKNLRQNELTDGLYWVFYRAAEDNLLPDRFQVRGFAAIPCFQFVNSFMRIATEAGIDPDTFCEVAWTAYRSDGRFEIWNRHNSDNRPSRLSGLDDEVRAA